MDKKVILKETHKIKHINIENIYFTQGGNRKAINRVGKLINLNYNEKEKI